MVLLYLLCVHLEKSHTHVFIGSTTVAHNVKETAEGSMIAKSPNLGIRIIKSGTRFKIHNAVYRFQ